MMYNSSVWVMPLGEKAAAMEAELKARHWYRGLVLPLVILPPKGSPDCLGSPGPSSPMSRTPPDGVSQRKSPGLGASADSETPRGNFEDCSIWTGTYLAGQVWRWKATGDPDASASAQQAVDALLFLEAVTGHPGYLARGFKEADGPSWDEELFWNRSWWQSGEYRWMGQVTKDQAGGRLFGLCTYFDLMDDEPRKRLIRESVSRVFGQIVRDGMRIVDIGDGSFRRLYAEHRGEIEFAVQALFCMKAAWHITGEEIFRDKYAELIAQQYHLIAIEGSPRKHNRTRAYAGIHHSDTHLVFMGLYCLLQYETDEAIRSYYSRAVERNFGTIQTEGNAFHSFVYHSIFEDCGDDESAIQTLREMPIDRRIRPVRNSDREDLDPSTPLPVYERPAAEYEWAASAYRLDGWPDADGAWEHSTADFLTAYWMGRYHGYIAEGD